MSEERSPSAFSIRFLGINRFFFLLFEGGFVGVLEHLCWTEEVVSSHWFQEPAGSESRLQEPPPPTPTPSPTPGTAGGPHLTAWIGFPVGGPESRAAATMVR